jgi:hypothetical protein
VCVCVCVCVSKEFYKELVHTGLEAEKSKICSQQAGNLVDLRCSSSLIPKTLEPGNQMI